MSVSSQLVALRCRSSPSWTDRQPVTAIEEAIERGGKPGHTSKAEGYLLEAEALRMVASFSMAIDAYKDALKKAEGA